MKKFTTPQVNIKVANAHDAAVIGTLGHSGLAISMGLTKTENA